MTQTSAPWTGTATGDAGAYGANTWAQIWSHITGSNDLADIGVLSGIEDELEVVATSPATTQVQVSTGSALVQGKWYYNDTAENLTIAANGSGNDRIDRVVLQADYVAQTVRLAVKQGTPAVSPSAPGLTQTTNTFWEVPLAQVYVANGFTSLDDDDINDERTFANTALLHTVNALNNTGTVLSKGSVVALVGAAGNEIATTTTAADSDIVGVTEGTIANGASGRVITRGVAKVLCTGTVSAGDFLESSATAALAQTATGLTGWGRVLVPNTGTGEPALAYIDTRPAQKVGMGILATNSANQSISSGVTTAVQFDTNLGTNPNTNIHSTVTNNSRFTAPVTGDYLLIVNIALVVSGAGNYNFFIRTNGVTTYTTTGSTAIGVGAAEVIQFNPILVLPLVAGDYIQVQCNTTAATSRVITRYDVASFPPFFAMKSPADFLTHSSPYLYFALLRKAV